MGVHRRPMLVSSNRDGGMKIGSDTEPLSQLQLRQGDLVGRRPAFVDVLPERPDPVHFKIGYDDRRSITVRPRGCEVIRQAGKRVLIRVDAEVVEEAWPVDPEPPAQTDIQFAKRHATKQCRRCQQVLPVTEFSRDRTKLDRRKSWCRRCVTVWTRERRRLRRARRSQ